MRDSRSQCDGAPIRGRCWRIAPVLAATVVATLACGDEPIPPEPATMSVNPGSLRFAAFSDTSRLSAQVRDQNGELMEGVAITWASGDQSVATVDSMGLVRSAGNGEAVVTATAGSVSASADVTVEQVVSAINVSPEAVEFTALGDTARLGAEAFDANGHPVEGAEFSWASGADSVATVDSGGLVRSAGNGEAAVTATSGSVADTAGVEVAQVVDAVTVSPEAVEFSAFGDTLRLSAEALDANDYQVEGAELSWASGNQSVATVDSMGLVRSAGNGESAVTATSESVSDSAVVEVRQVLTAVTVMASADSLVEGDTLRFSAEATDANGVTVAGAEFEWSSSDTMVATVDESGLVTGVVAGRTEIVAISSGVEGGAPLTVVEPAPTTVEVTPDTAEFTAFGQTEQLAAVVRDQIGRTMEGAPVSWTSGDTAVAVVDSAGLVTAAGAGSAAVTATSGTASGTAVVVVAQLADSVVVSPAADTVMIDDTLRLLAEAFDENGHEVDGAAFVWSSSEVSVAVVDASGLVEGVGEGTAEITAAAGDARGTSEITVENPDRDVLVALYRATGGLGWANSQNWLTQAPLNHWYGVATNGAGRVVSLKMRLNDMNGPIPPEIGGLSKLEVLELVNSKLRAPGLTGQIPAALGRLSNLIHLNLNSNSLSGPIPPELGRLANLDYLQLPYNFLSGSIPAELGDLDKLTDLGLHGNRLTGSIPVELGDLPRLNYLWLFKNELTGPIPGALGNLSELYGLGLYDNALTGPIPPELSRLSKLTRLWLNDNELESIPPELGGLSSVKDLRLYDNRLTGPIPGELAQLTVADLFLFRNNLTGSLPPELAEMGSLRRLWLSDNELTGSVPPEFGNSPALDELDLTNNPGMSGPLPVDLKDLGRFGALLTGGTELCAPSDSAFQEWLRRVPRQRVRNCAEGDPPPVYLVQAAQSREFPTPLVADEEALLRVFVTSPNAGGAGIPPVTATFFAEGEEVHVAKISAKSTPIPKEVDEGDLDKSSNAVIPDSVLLEGLELVVEIDPDSTLHDSITIVRRIPETGRMDLDVVAVPTFDVTAIPFLWTEEPDSSVLDIVEEMARDPDSHKLLFETRTLLPVGELKVTAHEPVWTSSRSAFDILSKTATIRIAEGGTGYWQGLLEESTGASGVAHTPGWSSFSRPVASTMAHEFGHNMSLFHAPCGGAGGADPAFPQSDGSIGVWGHDFRDSSLVSPRTADLMSYCRPPWIGNYHFGTALRYRMWAEEVWEEDPPPGPPQALLLWGGVDAGGDPFLEPAFVIEAPAALPAKTGGYRLSGHAADERELFSFSFEMADVPDGDGSRSFAFALPARPEWAESLAGITLEGPGGSAALGLEADAGMAMLSNPETGQVRGLVRVPEPGLLLRTVATALEAEPGLVIQFSTGIPDPEAWQR